MFSFFSKQSNFQHFQHNLFHIIAGCSGPTVTVSGGTAQINVPTGDVPLSMISTSFPASGSIDVPDGPGPDGPGPTPPTNSECTTCSCSNKVDCGVLGKTQAKV